MIFVVHSAERAHGVIEFDECIQQITQLGGVVLIRWRGARHSPVLIQTGALTFAWQAQIFIAQPVRLLLSLFWTAGIESLVLERIEGIGERSGYTIPSEYGKIVSAGIELAAQVSHFLTATRVGERGHFLWEIVFEDSVSVGVEREDSRHLFAIQQIAKEPGQTLLGSVIEGQYQNPTGVDAILLDTFGNAPRERLALAGSGGSHDANTPRGGIDGLLLKVIRFVT